MRSFVLRYVILKHRSALVQLLYRYNLWIWMWLGWWKLQILTLHLITHSCLNLYLIIFIKLFRTWSLSFKPFGAKGEWEGSRRHEWFCTNSEHSLLHGQSKRPGMCGGNPQLRWSGSNDFQTGGCKHARAITRLMPGRWNTSMVKCIYAWVRNGRPFCLKPTTARKEQIRERLVKIF